MAREKRNDQKTRRQNREPLGVCVTVLAAGFTNTPVLEKFGFDPKTMPMKPMSVSSAYLRASAVCLKTAPKSFQAG
jgi:hypothetical protein